MSLKTVKIANPIYDVVFKYLLEDTEIACELLSAILGTKVLSLDLKPQETLVTADTGIMRIFHLDFRAMIDLGNGNQKMVLIELQKAKRAHDILRFRKYLGENYAKEEIRINALGEPESYSLEIVTIYFLGFKLKGVNSAVLKVGRRFEDVITGKATEASNEFISQLTHESYTIQIPRLQNEQRSQLAEVLEVFSQKYVVDDMHVLQFVNKSKNPLVAKMLRRLQKAAESKEIQRKMDAEDSLSRILSRQADDYEEKLRKIEQGLIEKEEQLQESERQREQERIENAQKIAEMERKMEEILKKLNKD